MGIKVTNNGTQSYKTKSADLRSILKGKNTADIKLFDLNKNGTIDAGEHFEMEENGKTVAYYSVKKGDSASKIAKKFGVKTDDIKNSSGSNLPLDKKGNPILRNDKFIKIILDEDEPDEDIKPRRRYPDNNYFYPPEFLKEYLV